MNETVRLVLRMPKDIWAGMKEWAQEEDRSLNSQIIWVLRRALDSRLAEK